MNSQLEKAINYEQSIKKVKSLLKKGAHVNARLRGSLTPLHLAVSRQNSQMVSLLLENGASVTAKDQYGNIPLHKASNVSITKLLLEYGSPVNTKNDQGTTPLHRAVQWIGDSHEPQVKLLIKKGASINARDNYNNTPLHICCGSRASYHSAPWKVRVLLDNGATVNVKNNIGATPLLLAVDNTGDRDVVTVVTYLLDAGANPNVRKGQLVEARNRKYVLMDGATALHIAAEKGMPEVVKLLLRAGAKPNAKYDRLHPGGITPLHEAVRSQAWFIRMNQMYNSKQSKAKTILERYAKTIRYLLASGANPNQKNLHGETPLHRASSNIGLIKTVQQLLDAGANPVAKDNDGVIPIQKARESKREDIATVLEKARNRIRVTAIKSVNKYQVPNNVKWRILANTEMFNSINRLGPIKRKNNTKKRKRNNAQ
jgi:ankyrin repeat protein